MLLNNKKTWTTDTCNTWMKLKIMLRKEARHERLYKVCMIPFTRHSGKGKTIATVFLTPLWSYSSGFYFFSPGSPLPDLGTSGHSTLPSWQMRLLKKSTSSHHVLIKNSRSFSMKIPSSLDPNLLFKVYSSIHVSQQPASKPASLSVHAHLCVSSDFTVLPRRPLLLSSRIKLLLVHHDPAQITAPSQRDSESDTVFLLWTAVPLGPPIWGFWIRLIMVVFKALSYSSSSLSSTQQTCEMMPVSEIKKLWFHNAQWIVHSHMAM